MKPLSKTQHLIAIILSFLIGLSAFYQYYSFSLQGIPLKQDLMLIDSNVENFEVLSRSHRSGSYNEYNERINIDFMNNKKIIYLDDYPKYDQVKKLLLDKKDLLFFVAKKDKYKYDGRQIAMSIKFNGELVTYNEFIRYITNDNDVVGFLGFCCVLFSIFLIIIFVRKNHKV